MNRRTINLFIFISIMLTASAGCDQTQPITLSQIPLYPNTKPISENDVLALPLAESLKQSTGLDDMQTEMQIVNLTGDSSWQRMHNFYDTAMKELNWGISEDYDREMKFVNVSGWTRGNWSEEQVLLISRMDDPLKGSPYLIMILFTK